MHMRVLHTYVGVLWTCLVSLDPLKLELWIVIGLPYVWSDLNLGPLSQQSVLLLSEHLFSSNIILNNSRSNIPALEQQTEIV